MFGLVDRRAELDMTGNVNDLGGASRGEITANQSMPEGLPFDPNRISVMKMSMRSSEAISASNVVTPDMMSTSTVTCRVFGQHAAEHLLILLIVFQCEKVKSPIVHPDPDFPNP